MTDFEQLIFNCIEQLQEMGKIKINNIDNLGEVIEELEKKGYNTTLDSSTDYLILDN